jgi:hypothetical protein
VHYCPFYEISITAFIIENKFWTFHYWLLKSIIYYVALGGHKKKWYIKFETTQKKKKLLQNNIFKSIYIVTIVGLAWWPFFEF